MNQKDIRWRQIFENFERSYKLLDMYSNENIKTELERAGIIQFFEITFELSWKVMKDYLEPPGYIVENPRDAIKQAYRMGLIVDGHIWLDALSKRNMTTHTYDEVMSQKLVTAITCKFLPVITKLYEKLSEQSQIFGLLKHDIELIIKALRECKEIEKAVIIGSGTNGFFKNGPDLHIAIFGLNVTGDTISNVYELLNEVYPLPYFFNLINFEAIKDEDLLELIDRIGTEVYVKP